MQTKFSKLLFTNLALCLLASGISFFIGEALVLATGKDLQEVVLYTGDANPEVHQQSDPSSGRLFELRPNSGHSYPNPGALPYKVSVNKYGFRTHHQNKTKSQDTIRILIFGGSNTYGANTDQDKTYPSQLEKELKSHLGKNVEVWNGGISAYNLYQKLLFADTSSSLLKPDLIIIQHFINLGRRPFFKGTQKKPYFRQDRDLYYENIPFLLKSAKDEPFYHKLLVSYSAIYRFVLGLLQKELTNRKDYHQFSKDHYLRAGEKSALLKSKSILKKLKNQKIIFFDPLNRHSQSSYLGLPVIHLKDRPKDPLFLEIHPPPFVYSWYGKRLASELIEGNHLLSP